MNNVTITQTFGWIITGENILSLLILLYTVRYEFLKCVDRVNTKKALKFHFTLLMMSWIFTIANAYALYRMYHTLVVQNKNLELGTLENVLIDRSLMLITGIGFIYLGHNFKKNYIEEDEDGTN